jgi:C-terminal processing protease CtpA/Prc
MHRCCILALATVGALAAGAAPADLTPLLTFEAPSAPERPAGWGGGPAGTFFADTLVVHGGRAAGRLERTAASPSTFSTFSTSIPADLAGQTIALRGWLRTDEVSEWVGLWLREDGEAGVLKFDNMQARQVGGTTPWTEYTIELPLDPGAEKIVFGALLVGSGRAWVDDLQLLVDGKPMSEAPPRVRELTILDTDHEFDAGSGVQLTELSAIQTQNLVVLGKIWGFLKYHHPAVVAGDRHWDYDLFRILPRVLQAEDQETANDILVDWIDDLGLPDRCTVCVTAPPNPPQAGDLTWLGESGRLGGELVSRLLAIHRDREHRDQQFYVSFARQVGNADFSRELAYATDGVPDAGQRVLAVYRFWNQVAYWFPYRDLIDEDWDRVLDETLPLVAAATTRDDYRLVLLALIARVQDTHANLWNGLEVRPPRGDAALPVTVRFIGDEAIVTGYNHDFLGRASNLEPGDVIEQIDHRPVRELVALWTPWYAASNQPARLRDMARMLTRGPVGPCSIQVRRAGESSVFATARVPLDSLDLEVGRRHDRPGPTCQKLDDDVAYLKLSSVATDSIAAYLATMAGTRGLVVDIRNYPSAFMVFDFVGHLVTAPTPFATFTKADAANPGTFQWTPPVTIAPLQPHYAGKIVVLIDEVTQSSAEYTTMAFRAAGAAIIGSTTAGADGNVSRIVLPGGLQTMFSGIGVFYPDHTPTQRVGIVPDIEVRPTAAGIAAGRDELLEAALAELREDR